MFTSVTPLQITLFPKGIRGCRPYVAHSPTHPQKPLQIIGTVILTRHYAADDRTVEHVTVDHADPEIVISDALITDVACNVPDIGQQTGRPYYGENYRRGARMEPSPQRRICPDGCGYPSHPFCWTSWLFHIDAKDRHLVYRLTEYIPHLHAWRAIWPD